MSTYLARLRCRDPTLKCINKTGSRRGDFAISELVKSLTFYPNITTMLQLSGNKLTDITGINIAQYVAVSSVIEHLWLMCNRFTIITFLEIAAALRVNTSLKYLYLADNFAAKKDQIYAAFVDTLRLNPVRSSESNWHLYYLPRSEHDVDFKRLKYAAEKSTPPSMLEFLLCVHLDTEKIKTTIC